MRLGLDHGGGGRSIRRGEAMRMRAWLAALGGSLLAAGAALLLANSSASDVGIVLLGGGGVFLLWYRVGVLETRVAHLYEEFKTLRRWLRGEEEESQRQ